jgi:lysophospholipase L1-like esterase
VRYILWRIYPATTQKNQERAFFQSQGVIAMAALKRILVTGIVYGMSIATWTCGAALTQIDLNDRTGMQVVIDREKGQYLGHPTTVLLEDGKTIYCVYPKGHGRGAIVMKRSDDAGLTWSDRLPTPATWATSKEVPTLHRVIDAQGKKRIIMWSGLYPARLAHSEDDGKSWSELKAVGDWGGIVVMGFVEALRTGSGHYLAMFHDDGRFFKEGGKRVPTMTLYKTSSTDGGMTWSFPEAVYASSEVHLCEPGCIRSPDGKQLAVLLRENRRVKNSHVIFSDDEGKTWSQPCELPLTLTGDRHTGKYGPDGRLFLTFRCRSPRDKASDRPFEGDWVGWIGTYENIVKGDPGQYILRMKDNTKNYDTTYPGVEVLPDGTFVTTTYGHWDQGEAPYILSMRFKMEQLDALSEADRIRGQLLKQSRLKVVAFGDSTTAPRAGVNQVYAQRLTSLLAARGLHVRVVNSGVGGSHTGYLSDNAHHKRRHALDRLEDAVFAHAPDVVIIQYGINDSYVDTGGPEGESRIPLHDYTANLTAMVNRLGPQGAQVILLTPNAFGLAQASWRHERLAQYAAGMRKVAADLKIPLIDVHRFYETYGEGSPKARDALLLDGSHPNDKGHAIVAEKIADRIEGLVESGRLKVKRLIFEQQDLFVSGEEGVANFRIPALCVTPQGTLLAVCDARVDRGGDLPNNIDQVLRRSTDLGKTWSPMRTIVNYPGTAGAADPSLTVDCQTGTIWLSYAYGPEGVGLAGGKNMPGYGDDTFHLHLRRSDDDGKTWSKPIDITRQVKQPEWKAVWNAPGKGIQTRDGRLLIGFSAHDEGNRPSSHVACSDDHGNTWRAAQAGRGTNENQIVELNDGRLLVSMRRNGLPYRVVAHSRDSGWTWQSQQTRRELVGAGGCQGCIARYSSTRNGDAHNILLHSYPGKKGKRENMTVYVSFDEGENWPIVRQINEGYAAYSCITRLPDDTIGLLYEYSQADGRHTVGFARLSLEWLLASGQTFES